MTKIYHIGTREYSDIDNDKYPHAVALAILLQMVVVVDDEERVLWMAKDPESPMHGDGRWWLIDGTVTFDNMDQLEEFAEGLNKKGLIGIDDIMRRIRMGLTPPLTSDARCGMLAAASENGAESKGDELFD